MAKDNFGKKRNAAGCINIPASGFRESEDHLTMRLCLQDAVINSAKRIGKFIDKQELYRTCPPRRVKDSNISKIENTLCVRNVLEVTVVYGIERVHWGPASILRRVNDGFFIYTCNVQSVEYYCWKKHAFVNDSHFKPLHHTTCYWILIDNRADAPISVLEDKDKEFFCGM